jgi:pimeloyl-ACP methyl ester carboxylesterase
VLLHGFTGSWPIWRPVLEPLERHHEVYAPTLPGHHGAAALADGIVPSVEALTDAVEAGLDDAGIQRAHLAGNSLGGWISLELARRGRALSVTALSPAGGFADARALRRVTRLITTSNRMTPALTKRGMALVRGRRSRRMLFRLVAEHGDRIGVDEATAMLEAAGACVVFDDFIGWVRSDGRGMARMDAAGIPIRIAWGQHDRLLTLKRYGRPLVDLIPGAELVVLPGVGHVPMYDDPDLVVRTILDTTTSAREEAAA